mmetsp:Transcript_23949/g.42650  ORF Transcript_23949/g.42650 Transcript_23949/m.42650 type:complete len:176 (+) Transcript_23949:68-595(+)
MHRILAFILQLMLLSQPAVAYGYSSTIHASTTVAPPKTTKKGRTRPVQKPGGGDNPLEYLEDWSAARGDDDDFHILLLGATFEKPRITVSYVVGQLCYTLQMPETDAMEHATFAQEQGLSCLGTWSRKECLDLGSKLQVRDIVCRVVPGAEGGGRPWQARNAGGGGDGALPQGGG